ncbi:MAG: MFS transporter [Chloroflexi bacterium]|nr:MFS transporter [Chloroflexota bacterium]
MNTKELDAAQDKRSLKHFHAEAGFAGVEEAGNSYQSASMVAIGSDWHGVGALSGFTSLVTSVLYLQIPSVVRLLGSAKRAVLALCLLDTLTWLPILFVMLLLNRVNASLLIGLWILNLVPGILLGPVRTTWMVSLTHADNRGKYLGLRLSINTASYIVSFYAMGYLLQRFSDGRALIGFAVVFAVALVATLLSFFVYTRISEPPHVEQEDESFRFIDFLRETQTRNLGRFVLYTSLFTFTVFLAAPFFAVYMLNELRFDYMTFAVISSSELIARTLTMPIWGHCVNRFGNLRLVRIASLLIPLVPLLWLVSSNLVYLVLVQVFSGVVWAGFDLCTPNFIFQTVSPKKRLKYIVFHKALSMAAMSLGGLTAVLLLSHVNPLFGSPVLAMFLLSGVLRFVVAATMLPRVRDLRKTSQPRSEEPLVVPTMVLASVPNGGLLHRPAQWSYFKSLPHLAPEAHEVRTAPAPGVVGLLSRPREWHRFSKPLSLASRTGEAIVNATASRRGLFYRPRGGQWPSALQALAPVAVPDGAGAVAREGLFYRPQHWDLLTRQPVHSYQA